MILKALIPIVLVKLRGRKMLLILPCGLEHNMSLVSYLAKFSIPPPCHNHSLDIATPTSFSI